MYDAYTPDITFVQGLITTPHLPVASQGACASSLPIMSPVLAEANSDTKPLLPFALIMTDSPVHPAASQCRYCREPRIAPLS
jgi:hypothetical protein